MAIKNTFVKMVIIISLLISIIIFSQSEAHSQIEVQCGQIIEGEFLKDHEQYLYHLPMQPREKFDVKVKTTGDFLKVAVAIYGPTDIRLGQTNNGYPSQLPEISSGTLSGRGVYKI